MENRKFDLQERLIDFSIAIMNVSESLDSNFAAKHIGGQLLCSGTSPALNYGEAQSAESPADFIHKMKICLKELRETHIGLKIIDRKPLTNKTAIVHKSLDECNQLISIFVKSIQTATDQSKHTSIFDIQCSLFDIRSYDKTDHFRHSTGRNWNS